MIASYAVTAKITEFLRYYKESMFEPRLPNLFEAIGVSGSAAHPI